MHDPRNRTILVTLVIKPPVGSHTLNNFVISKASEDIRLINYPTAHQPITCMVVGRAKMDTMEAILKSKTPYRSYSHVSNYKVAFMHAEFGLTEYLYMIEVMRKNVPRAVTYMTSLHMRNE